MWEKKTFKDTSNPQRESYFLHLIIHQSVSRIQTYWWIRIWFMTQAFDDQEIEKQFAVKRNLNSFLGLPEEIPLLNEKLPASLRHFLHFY